LIQLLLLRSGVFFVISVLCASVRLVTLLHCGVAWLRNCSVFYFIVWHDTPATFASTMLITPLGMGFRAAPIVWSMDGNWLEFIPDSRTGAHAHTFINSNECPRRNELLAYFVVLQHEIVNREPRIGVVSVFRM
jgi:hypothetical protein